MPTPNRKRGGWTEYVASFVVQLAARIVAEIAFHLWR